MGLDRGGRKSEPFVFTSSRVSPDEIFHNASLFATLLSAWILDSGVLLVIVIVCVAIRTIISVVDYVIHRQIERYRQRSSLRTPLSQYDYLLIDESNNEFH